MNTYIDCEYVINDDSGYVSNDTFNEIFVIT